MMTADASQSFLFTHMLTRHLHTYFKCKPELSIADGKFRERPILGVNGPKSTLAGVVSALRGAWFGFRREGGLAARAAVFRESEDASAVRHNRENSDALCQGAGKRVKDSASS